MKGIAKKTMRSVLAVLALGLTGVGNAQDNEMAMRWWNTLNGAQMVAALHGDDAMPEQEMAAKMMYADLDSATQALVDAAAEEIYGDGGFTSVGQWWETLDCRLMRIAAGDGNMADPSSAYCAHYPGSGAAKILSDEATMWVDTVGKALLGRSTVGTYPLYVAAMRWWNTLDGAQMVAALHGDSATPEQEMAAKMMYADLDDATKALVDAAAAAIYGDGDFTSVGQWWETLDCRLMRIAAGDGNMADPSSAYCAHYPGSGAAKILSDEATMWVDTVGMALLGRTNPGLFPAERAIVPLFPAVSDSSVHEGVVRIINHSMTDADVHVHAFDDAGTRYGPVEISVGVDTVLHFNSSDLVSGNAEKGLMEGIGEDAMGYLRLSLRSASDIEGLAYLRDGSMNLNSIHDLVPDTDAGHRVAFFNPASNMTMVSMLRIVNVGDAMAEIRIEGKDDGGACSEDPVELKLAPGAARMLSSQALESGEGEGLSGALGDGMGKWRLLVSADEPIAVMSLVHNRSNGALANVSTTTAAPSVAGCE